MIAAHWKQLNNCKSAVFDAQHRTWRRTDAKQFFLDALKQLWNRFSSRNRRQLRQKLRKWFRRHKQTSPLLLRSAITECRERDLTWMSASLLSLSRQNRCHTPTPTTKTAAALSFPTLLTFQTSTHARTHSRTLSLFYSLSLSLSHTHTLTLGTLYGRLV